MGKWLKMDFHLVRGGGSVPGLETEKGREGVDLRVIGTGGAADHETEKEKGGAGHVSREGLETEGGGADLKTEDADAGILMLQM